MEKTDTFKSEATSDCSIPVTVSLLLILMAAGFWLRMSALGDRQLAQDEYYFVTSVRNILDFGLPRYPDGGYYVRGMLPQYLTAISIYLFGDGNFAYRLPAALFGTGTIAMSYFLARQFLDRTWSILLAMFLTFSSWEIEFSRFVRMYAPFQFVAVCFFWSLYRHSFDENSMKRYFAIAIAIVGVFTHELFIFVAIFLFLPVLAWLDTNWRVRFRGQLLYIVLSIIVLLIGVFLVKYPFRFIGVSNPLPADFIKEVQVVPHWLAFGADLFGKNSFLVVGGLLVVCIAGWYGYYIFRKGAQVDVEEQVLCGLIAAAACCAVFHQFALCAMIMFIVVLRKPKAFLERPYVYYIVLLFGLVFFWLVALWLSQPWSDADGVAGMVRAYRRSIRQNFFVFPDLYLPVINKWARTLPIMGFFLGLAVVHQIIRIRKSTLGVIAKNPAIPVVVVVVLMGVQPPNFFETRYIYFLYPLALCVALLSAGQFAEALRPYFAKPKSVTKFIMIGLCLFGFSLTEDFDTFHLSHAHSDEVAFRTDKYERFSAHWYQRWDFERPAEFLNKAVSDGDTVIVSRDVDTLGFYLSREYTIYFPRDAADYGVVSRSRGTRELWSGKPMISSIPEVPHLARNSERVWLALYPGWGSLKLDPESVWPGRIKNVQVFTPGRDKRVEIWKIELNRAYRIQ